MGEVLRHGANLGDAIVRLTRFARLLGPGLDMRLVVHGEQAVLEDPQHCSEPALHAQAVFCKFAAMALNARDLTGAPLDILEFRFMAPRPAAVPVFDRFMDAPVRFGAGCNALVFPSRIFHLPIRMSDAARCSACEQQAQDLLDRISQEQTFTSPVSSSTQ